MSGADELVVAEVFGPTIQGEGPSMGRRASFVRLGGCNLHCTWCDTPYTWDASRFNLRDELAALPVDAIATTVRTHGTDLTVITGGEPLLHQTRSAWARLLHLLPGDVEIETNGTQFPTEVTLGRAVWFNVSPKLTHSGDSEADRINPDALAALHNTGQAVFKFVCTSVDDLGEVQTICADAGIPPDLVWIMTEGVTVDAVLDGTRALAEPALACGYNLTTRLHTLIWGSTRAH